MDTPAAITPLIREGETCSRTLRYSREQIIEFARLSGDANPLHHSQQAAQRAHFGEIIASGQQTAAQLMGLLASWFSRHDDGIVRELLLLNFNFAFKLPVFAEQDIRLAWTVAAVESSPRRGGFIAQLHGQAGVAGRSCVVGRGTILLRRGAPTVG